MVTDGRFSSLFACLTWKCRPMERLLATPLQAVQDSPQRLPQTRCTCWNRARTHPSPPLATLLKWSFVRERAAALGARPPPQQTHLTISGCWRICYTSSSATCFISRAQFNCCFMKPSQAFSLPLILQPFFRLERQDPVDRNTMSLHFRSSLAPNNYLHLANAPLPTNTLTPVR